MTWGVEFLLRFWREALIGALILTIVVMGRTIVTQHDSLILCEERFKSYTDQAESKANSAKEKYAKTVMEINREHSKLVEQAKNNAVENYTRRYGILGSTGIGFRVPDSSLGLSNLPTDTTGTSQTNRPEGAQRESFGVDACDPRFINDAAEAAVIIDGWNQWADKNELPREAQ